MGFYDRPRAPPKKLLTQVVKSVPRSCSRRYTLGMRVLRKWEGEKRGNSKKKINQNRSWRRRTARTFGDFDPFDGLVVHRAGALFDELVAFDTEIEDICALHAELDEPFHRDVDNVGRSLPSCRRPDKKQKKKTLDDQRMKPSDLVFGDISLGSRPWLFWCGSCSWCSLFRI